MAEELTLLAKVKKGLGLSESTGTDGTVDQKIKTIVAYAEFEEAELTNDLVIGCIVVGVTDIWELGAGAIKFSEAFHMLLEKYRASKLISEV